MSKRSEALANRLEQAVEEFAKTIESCTDAQWRAVCNAEGWTVGQTAQHVAGQFPLEMEYVTAVAEGNPMPSYSWDDVNSKNEARAEKNASTTRSDVLKELRARAASTSTYIRALSDEQLDRTAALALADGAIVSTQQVIESGILIEHVTGHLESIRAGAGTVAAVA